jgi:predicted phage terminase large subunit-like protein
MIENYLFWVLPGFYFQGVKASGSKPVRAAAYSAMVEAKNFDIVRQKNMGRFFDVHEAFPFGTHDDDVDAASGAFNQLTVGGELRPASSRIRHIFRSRG